jgi:uncharacterized protein YcfJ
MDKSNLIGTVIGIGVATAIGAAAGYAVFGDAREAEADATRADAQSVRQNSYEVEAPVTTEPEDQKRIAGTAVRDETL